MNHSFNTQIAKEIGIYPAVLLETIAKSITKEHFHDGCFWMPASASYFVHMCPYLTASQVYRSLEKLVDCGFVKTGNYNKSKNDRTKWYALTEKSSEIYSCSSNFFRG